MSSKNSRKGISRRSFLRSAAALGAGVVLAPRVSLAADAGEKDLNIAFLGVGEQGRVLLTDCLKISGIRIKAICDIWTQQNQMRASRTLKAYKHEHNVYVDYQEMLDKEKDLDAVIIATPDFWHADHTVSCLKAGLNVYCEKEMSNTLEGARRMVTAAKETGKLLQIGHQRRSNPRYIHCKEKLLKEAKILGRITTVNGQWNRGVQTDNGWPKNDAIDEATLAKYAYKDMHQFRNWRWYKGLGGGPIVDLGSHQIDIYSWFLDCQPKSVMASGGTDYYDKTKYQWYDTVLAIYEYETKEGMVRAYYQTLTTNSSNGYFETFMGDQGTLIISEKANRSAIYKEASAPDWKKWVKAGFVNEREEVKVEKSAEEVLDSHLTVPPELHTMPITLNEPIHTPHLVNFFDAIRGKAKLNCPAEVGYESAVSVLKVNEAIEARKALAFDPAEFKV
jgi:predicted dehydrogenase